MRIGELAARTGVAPRLLRYYEQQGLLAPRRTTAGYRAYGEADVTRVQDIRSLLAAGLGTSAIRQILACMHAQTPSPIRQPLCPGAVAHLARHRDDLAHSLAKLAAQAMRVDALMEGAKDGTGVAR